MDLKQLRHFLAVAETESFSRGAARANVTQPALSASIAKLEESLGAKLFVRSKRGAALTPEGQRLLPTARSVTEACSRAKADLKRLARRETLRLGIASTLAAKRVATLIANFRAEVPDVFLDITDAPTADLGRSLDEGKLDLAILVRAQSEPKSASAIELFSEPYVLMIPEVHSLKDRRTITLDLLDGEPFIARTQCEYRQVLGQAMKDAGVRPRVTCRTASDDRAVTFVQAGLGVAVVPAHYEAVGTLKIPLRDHTLRWVLKQRTDASELASRFAVFARAARWPG